MKLLMTVFYFFGADDYYIGSPHIEIVSIYIEHMPLELKRSKRERWWPVKPYHVSG